MSRRINGILLNVLGSFYNNVGRTKFSQGVDKVYSEMIFSRYAEIVRAKAVSPDGSIPFVTRFGYIKSMDYNPVGPTISITSSTGVPVDMSRVRFIMLPYSDTDDFFRINDSTIEKRAIDPLSKTKGSNFPVIYVISERYDCVDFSIFDIPLRDKELSSIILKSVSSLAMYYPDNMSVSRLIANIISGCLFSRSKETIINITEDKVITDRNEYDYDSGVHGDIVVKKGDVLDGISLITNIVNVGYSGSKSSHMENIRSHMSIVDRGSSAFRHITKLSEMVAKREVMISIPIHFISKMDKESIDAMSSILNMSINSRHMVQTSMNEESIANATSSGKSILKRNANIYAATEEKILSEIGKVEEVLISETGILKMSSVDTVISRSYMHISMDKFTDEVTSSPSEEKQNVIDATSNVDYSETHDWDGRKTENVIIQTASDHIETIYKKETMSVSNHEDSIRSGKVSSNDYVSVLEHDKRDISYDDMSYIEVSDSRHMSHIRTDHVLLSDINRIGTTSFDSNEIGLSSRNAIGYKLVTYGGTSDDVLVRSVEAEPIHPSVTELRQGKRSEYFSISSSEAEAMVKRTIESIGIKDISYVDGEGTIEGS